VGTPNPGKESELHPTEPLACEQQTEETKEGAQQEAPIRSI